MIDQAIFKKTNQNFFKLYKLKAKGADLGPLLIFINIRL
jgi:hypothetical protein